MSADQVKIQVNALLASCPELQDDPELLADMLEGETDIMKVVRSLVMQHSEDMMLVNGIKARLTELGVRKGRLEHRMERVRETMTQLLSLLPDGQKVLRLAEATVRYRAPLKKVEVDNVDDLPQGFFKVEKTAKKDEIARALKAGEDVPGARLIDGDAGVTITTK